MESSFAGIDTFPNLNDRWWKCEWSARSVLPIWASWPACKEPAGLMWLGTSRPESLLNSSPHVIVLSMLSMILTSTPLMQDMIESQEQQKQRNDVSMIIIGGIHLRYHHHHGPTLQLPRNPPSLNYPHQSCHHHNDYNLKTSRKSWDNGNASRRNGFIANRIFPL